MSGHSKWHNIKNQKGAADQKKGLEFTKIANAIILAVKTGGGSVDPEANFKLRLAIEKAKSLNMPKDNIQRSIDKAKGMGEGDLAEITYEGFGPSGVAILVQTATDNRQRTVQEMKNIFGTNNGTLGGQGSVSYLFQNMGQITISKSGKSMDEIMDKVIEAGAEDLEDGGDDVLVYTKPGDLHEVQEKIKNMGFLVNEAELIFKPTTTIPISSKEEAHKVLNLLNKLEENESVQHVFANFDIPDEILNSLS